MKIHFLKSSFFSASLLPTGNFFLVLFILFQGLGPDDYIKDLDDDDTKDNKIIDDVAPHQVDRLSVSKQEPEIHKDFGGKCSNYEKNIINILYFLSKLV